MQNLPQRIHISIKPSPRLTVFVASSHLFALLTITWLPPDPLLRIALSTMLLVSFYRAWRGWVRFDSRSAVTGVVLEPSGEWTLFDGRGKASPARLRGSSFLSPSVTLLKFYLGRMRTRQVMLLSDNADPDSVRRLRVRLYGQY